MDQAKIIDIFKNWLCGEQGLSKLTEKTYSAVLIVFFKFLQNHRGEEVTVKQLLVLSLSDIRAFLAYRSVCHIKHQSNAVALSAIKTFYRFLSHQGHDVQVLLALLRRPRLPRILPRPLSESLLQKLEILKPLGNDWIEWRNYSLALLLYATGMRINEAISLCEKDLSDVIWVKGKRQKERALPILSIAEQAVRHYLSLCPYSKKDQESPIFWGAKGKRLQAPLFQKYIRHWRDRLNWPDHATPHSLRHSFASHLIEHGAPLRDVQELLGHTSISATQRYIETTHNHIQEIYRTCHPRANIDEAIKEKA